MTRRIARIPACFCSVHCLCKAQWSIMSWSAGSKEHISREVAYLDACTGLAAFRSADPWTRGSRTRGSLAVNYFSREHFWLHQLNIRAQNGEHQHFFAAVDRLLVLPSFHLPLTNWAVESQAHQSCPPMLPSASEEGRKARLTLKRSPAWMPTRLSASSRASQKRQYRGSGTISLRSL
jgi:hypothetical protein